MSEPQKSRRGAWSWRYGTTAISEIRVIRSPSPASRETDRFELETYTGGTNNRHFNSYLRFDDHGKWTEQIMIQENQPAERGGYWFFQATWDAPQPRLNSGGWNHTGLGVGNREGVGVMLLGVCVSVTGMLFAFYVKPVIKRRRRAAVQASLEA